MIKISGVIITYNEERYLEKCLQSLVGVVDEIIVVDSFSTDGTKAICEKFDATFIEQKFLGYIEQKNFALSKTTFDYVVSLDGDESLSETLQKSIKQLKNNWVNDGYYANRFNNFCGQWIRHSDWYPNKKLRVFNKNKVSWKGINPHDHIELNNTRNKTGHLKGDILHHTYQSYAEYNLKMDQFSTIAAQAYFDRGKRSSLWKLIWNPFWAFFKAYFLRLGILDGFNGYMICYQTGNYTFLKYAKLRELQKKEKTE